MDPAKLKVVDLRAALAERGLDTKGNKPVLVERLRKALEEETQERNQERSSLHVEDIGEDPQERVEEATRSSQPPRTPSRASRSSSMTTPTKISTRNASKMATSPNYMKISTASKLEFADKTYEVLPPISESASEEPVAQQEEITKVSPENPIEKQQDATSEYIVQNKIYSPLSEKSQEDKAKHILEDNKYEVNVSQVPVTKPSEKSSTIAYVDQFSKTQEEHEAKVSNAGEVRQESPAAAEDTTKLEEDVEMKDVDEDNFEKNIDDKDLIDNEDIQDTENSCDTKDDVDIPEADKSADNIVDEINKTDEVIKFKEKEKIDEDYAMEDEKVYSLGDIEDACKKTEEDISQVEKTAEMAEIKKEDAASYVEESNQKECDKAKRKRSASPTEIQQASPVTQKPEDEPDFDKYNVILSWYDSDLNLVINKEGFVSAAPMHTDDFCHMWAGARASCGFTSGKVFYEAKITEHCFSTEKDEKYSPTLRIGWSVPYTSMQLGEEKLSYAYTSTGQKGTDGKFADYGSRFGKGDVVGCYLDMTRENTVKLTYTLNGKDLGSAFSVSKEELGDKPLFPHILSKNCTFVCNFGQEEAWCERIPEYTVVGDVEAKDRVPGPRRPVEKADCEVIMMCGLPAAGKTTWARKHVAEHSDKLYNILALHNLVEKTKDVSLSDQNACPRDTVIDKCNRALDQLIDVASSRRRNYILEQKSNVYISVQRRKMRNFCGYQRKAVVVIPTDEEYKQRLSTRDAIEGNTSRSNIDEMKANFTAPSVGESFDVVEWVGLDEEEGKKLVEKYTKEGKEAGFNQQPAAKRSRFDTKSESNRNTRDSRNNSRDNRRNNYQDRSRNPVWRGANMGGWRGDRPQRGGYMRHVGYGPPPVPWRLRGRGGPAMIRGADRRHGGIERRTGNDRNRHVASRQGGWGPMSSNYQGSQQSSWNQPDTNWSSSGQSNSSQGSWNQQSSSGGGGGGWGQWGGGWKGYGQSNTYGGQAYNQGYGNGNWNWNQQYYNNQYWDQQQQSGQTTATGGQAASKQ